MFGKIFRLLFHTAICILVFLGLVWVLLGITPTETYLRSRDTLGRLFSQANIYAGKVSKTGNDMKKAGDSQLQQASDRFHGKDPYEKLNRKLSSDVKKL